MIKRDKLFLPEHSYLLDDEMIREVLLVVADGGTVTERLPDVPPRHAVRAVLHERVVELLVEVHLPRTTTWVHSEVGE